MSQLLGVKVANESAFCPWETDDGRGDVMNQNNKSNQNSTWVALMFKTHGDPNTVSDCLSKYQNSVSNHDWIC